MTSHREIHSTVPVGVESTSPEPLPNRLYKYVGPDRVDILKTEKILFSTVARLNDPFEMRPRFPAPKIAEVQLAWENYVKQQYARLPAEVRLKTSFADFQQQADQKAEQEMGTWENRQAFMNESYGRQKLLKYILMAMAQNGLCRLATLAIPVRQDF